MKFSLRLEKIPEKFYKDWCGLRIWEKPKETHSYALGVDVAEGVGQDASCIQVVDCTTGLVAANYWSNHIDTDNYAAEVYKLAHYYNKAWVCIEANNHGHVVISHLSGQRGGLAYPKLYKRETWDEFTQKKTNKIGLLTTGGQGGTKARLIENLKIALRDGTLNVLDRLTVLELNSFVRDAKSGKMGAQGNAKDDRVMALALAWEQALIVRQRLDNAKANGMSDYAPRFDPMTGFPLF